MLSGRDYLQLLQILCLDLRISILRSGIILRECNGAFIVQQPKK